MFLETNIEYILKKYFDYRILHTLFRSQLNNEFQYINDFNLLNIVISIAI